MAVTKFRYLREGVRKLAVAPETKEILREGATQMLPGAVASLGYDTGALRKSAHVTTRIYKGKVMRAHTAYIIIDGVRPEDPGTKGSPFRLQSHAAYHEAETGNLRNFLARTHASVGSKHLIADAVQDLSSRRPPPPSAKKAAAESENARRASRKPVTRK